MCRTGFASFRATSVTFSLMTPLSIRPGERGDQAAILALAERLPGLRPPPPPPPPRPTGRPGAATGGPPRPPPPSPPPPCRPTGARPPSRAPPRATPRECLIGEDIDHTASRMLCR